MRCRNCHTVMMESDLECPVCHASAARATAAPPGPSEKPNGLLLLLPIFGGAVGGLAYAALASSEPGAPSGGPRGPHAARGPSRLKRVIGGVLIALGGLFLVLAFVHFWGTWEIARRQPQVLTAAELGQTKKTESAPAWIAYTFAESKPSELTVTRRRLANGGDVQARCLLVRVDDKWLVASVAPGFEGDCLVGRLVPHDSPATKSLIEQVRKLEPKVSSLLPFEINAVDGSASDQRLRYTAAAMIGFFGLLGLSVGLLLFRRGRRPAPSPTAAATNDWAYHPLLTSR